MFCGSVLKSETNSIQIASISYCKSHQSHSQIGSFTQLRMTRKNLWNFQTAYSRSRKSAFGVTYLRSWSWLDPSRFPCHFGAVSTGDYSKVTFFGGRKIPCSCHTIQIQPTHFLPKIGWRLSTFAHLVFFGGGSGISRLYGSLPEKTQQALYLRPNQKNVWFSPEKKWSESKLPKVIN